MEARRWIPMPVAALAACYVLACEPVVETPSEPAPRFEAAATEAWRAGGFEEDRDVLLEARPSAGVLGPGGVAAVAAGASGQVLILDGGGTLLRSFGGRGQGPGEFQGPSLVGMDGDSLFWVFDITLDRFTWFDADGRVVATRRAPRADLPGTPWSARGRWALADGRVLGRGFSPQVPRSPDGLPLPTPLSLWSGEDDPTVVGWLDRPHTPRATVHLVNGAPVTLNQPIQGTPIVGAATGGGWFFVLDRAPADAEFGTFRLDRYDLSGDLLDELEIAYRTEVLGDELWARIRTMMDSVAADMRANMGWDVTAEGLLDALWLPERLPPVREAAADHEGFWVQREATRPGLLERYDLDGDLVARLELPLDLRLLAGTRSEVLGWTFDSLYVPVLWKYDVTLSAREPVGGG